MRTLKDCILLAQWSKNFSYKEDLISGNILMDFIIEEIHKIQFQIGGSFMFLECEAKRTHLVTHYEKMGYTKVAERFSEDGEVLFQFIKNI